MNIAQRLKELAEDMNKTNDSLGIKRTDNTAQNMKTALGVAIAALETLARLGNAPHYGNSEGNTIAQENLRRIHEIFEPRDESELPGGGGL